MMTRMALNQHFKATKKSANVIIKYKDIITSPYF